MTTQGPGARSKEAIPAAARGRAELADQRAPPWLDRCSVALGRPQPMPLFGRLAVGEHAERDGRAPGTQSHDEMDVAGVETERDPPIGPCVLAGRGFQLTVGPGDTVAIVAALTLMDWTSD